MREKDKQKNVQKLRSIYDGIDIDKLILNPDNPEQINRIHQAIGIFTSFSHDVGEKLTELFEDFRKWARAGRRKEHIRNCANDLKQFIGRELEKMNVYKIESGENKRDTGGKDRHDKSYFSPQQPKIIGHFVWFLRLLKYNWIWGIVIIIVLLSGFTIYHVLLKDRPAFSYTMLSESYEARHVVAPTVIDAWFNGNVKNTFPVKRSLERIHFVLWKNKKEGSVYDYGYHTNNMAIYNLGINDQKTSVRLPILFEPNEAKHLGISLEINIDSKEDMQPYSEQQCKGIFCWPKNEIDILFEDANSNVFDKDGKLMSNRVMDLWFLLPNRKGFFNSILAKINLYSSITIWKIKRLYHWVE